MDTIFCSSLLSRIVGTFKGATHARGSIRSLGFWAEGDWWGFPYFSLSASRYIGAKQKLCLYWPLATVIITGPKALDFYAGFCARRTTRLKADGKDIKVLNLILSGNSDGASGTAASTNMKSEK